jgi:hypothetical protein
MEMKHLKILVEEAKELREKLDVLIREHNRENKKEILTDEDSINIWESFLALNKQKKEVEARVTQIVHRLLNEYKGDKKEHLRLLVEQYDIGIWDVCCFFEIIRYLRR